jgi:hypothetical protein
MDMHLDRLAIAKKYLLEEHPCNFAGLDVGVRHKMPLGSVFTGPTKTKTLFFGSSILNQDIARTWNLGFNSSAQRLHGSVTF